MKAASVKKLSISGLAVALVAVALVTVGCSSALGGSSASASASGSSSLASSEAIVGGWEVPASVEPVLSADDLAVYDSASGVEDSEQPVALLATQVVSGLNYAFLGKDAAGWNVVVCYKNADGKTMVTSTKAIELANIKTVEQTEEGNQPIDIAGGWTVQVPEKPAALPDKAQAAFTKALDGYTGVGLAPVALLGTQLVSGANYMVLCEGSPVVYDSKTALYVVVVYEDLQGNAEITSVNPFDLLYYIGN